jgi:virginiamycin B lyase
MGVVVDASGRVWLAQEEVHALGELDPPSGTYRQLPTPTPNSGPSGIALDGRGRVWFSELSAHAIGVYDPVPGRFAEYPIGDDHVYPYWLSVAPDGRVWFSNMGGGTIGVLDPADGRVQTIAVPGARGTTGIAVAGDGTVWFAVQEGALGSLRPGETVPTTVSLPSGSAYGVAIDTRGTVWIASSRSAVYSFDPGSGRLEAAGTGAGAWWLTAAHDGSIWVAEGSADGNALARIAPRS